MRFKEVNIDKSTGIHSFRVEANEEEIDFLVTFAVNRIIEAGMIMPNEDDDFSIPIMVYRKPGYS